MEKLPVFSSLPADMLAELARNMREESHPAGTVVIREGEKGDRLYLLAEGRAQVSTAGPVDPVTLATVETGGMFGEIALLNMSHRRQATVTTLTPVLLLSLSGATLEKLLAAHPDVRLDLALLAEAMLDEKQSRTKPSE